jgi:REP element-mobilizing transposase RayT
MAAKRTRKAPKQLELPLKTWGGRRAGAGRKPKGEKAGVSHLKRPRVTAHRPVHVTLRVAADVPNLRRATMAKVVIAALGAGKRGPATQLGFGLVHFSVQNNHLHLICEAKDNAALARGVKGLCVRVAKAINRVRGGKGRVFSDRYHAHVLATPREVRHALGYVLGNFRKHALANERGSLRGPAVASVRLDPFASGAFFDGFTGTDAVSVIDESAPIVSARGYLLKTGWRRHGLIDPYSVPSCHGAAAKRVAKKKKRSE